MFPAAVDFQQREYSEHQDHRSYDAEQNPSAQSQPRHRKEVSHAQSPQPEKGAASPRRAPNGKGHPTMPPLNRLLEVDFSHPIF